ncbi:MAG: type IVB secretion system protein IcmH/DotU [Proteobacteria bacterium]|nr:type IVB secretion system protein IcmH/DotU [Pseudomonadota bacterium]
MPQHVSDINADNTVMMLPPPRPQQEGLAFDAVAVAPGMQPPPSAPYLAQQTSFDDYTPGINPLVNAASELLLEIVRLRTSRETDLEALRVHLEAKVRGFTNQAIAAGISEVQVNAAQYLLCTALDESITSSSIPGAQGGWQHRSLLSTFHKDTWGGEVFFDVLSRIMEQPASRLYILELMYLLLSLGFEGKYRLQDRGPLAIESLRDQLYRQIRMLRGEPSPDLASKFVERQAGRHVYAYVPAWIVGMVVVICLAVTFFGFSHTLQSKGQPLAAHFAAHALTGKPYVAAKNTAPPTENAEGTPADGAAPPNQTNHPALDKTSGNTAANSARESRP